MARLRSMSAYTASLPGSKGHAVERCRLSSKHFILVAFVPGGTSGPEPAYLENNDVTELCNGFVTMAQCLAR